RTAPPAVVAAYLGTRVGSAACRRCGAGRRRRLGALAGGWLGSPLGRIGRRRRRQWISEGHERICGHPSRFGAPRGQRGRLDAVAPWHGRGRRAAEPYLYSGAMPLIAAGISFRTAPAEVRERASLSDPEARHQLRFLLGHAGLSGAAALSTCNRTEFYVSVH